MRAFEIATLVTSIPLLLRPFLPVRDRRSWVSPLLALPALFAVLHLTLEGPRWQMVPAYALIGLLLLLATLRLLQPIDASRAHRIINAYTLAFFDQHLAGQATPLLDSPSPDYPEVTFAVHTPRN